MDIPPSGAKLESRAHRRADPRTATLSPLTFPETRGFIRAPSSAAQPRARVVMKRTYQPHNTRRRRTHGFLARMASAGGRKVLQNRRRKGRWRLAISTYEK